MRTLVGAAEPPERPSPAWIPLNSVTVGSGQSTVVTWEDGVGRVASRPTGAPLNAATAVAVRGAWAIAMLTGGGDAEVLLRWRR